MFARLTVVDGSPDKLEQGIESFNSQILPVVKAIPGYKAAFLMVDRSTGKGIGMSLWETEEARNQANEAVAAACEATIKAMGGTVPPVDEYEVVVSDY